MYRLGIIGSDNSHAEIFSKLVNIPDERTGSYLFPDFRVTGIFGLDVKKTEDVAEKGKIGYLADKPEHLFGKVDAVMVVFRHGDLHMPYSLPFIEAGIPTWIDKPFTIKCEDAKKIIKSAADNNTLITGGSTCKYINDVQMIKTEAEGVSRIGRIKSAVLNFSATLNNEFGGIHFYGSHLCEMMLTAFGYDVMSVVASSNNGVVTAIAVYDRYQVTLNFIPGSNEYLAILYGEKGTIIREIDITGCYLKGFEKFIAMLRTKKQPEPYEHLAKSVELMDAIVRSYQDNTMVKLVPVPQ